MGGFLAAHEAFELFLEPAHAAATIHQLLIATCPCGMRGRVDFQGQRVAFLAIGRARLKRGAVSHGNRDHVVVGMAFFFHKVVRWIFTQRSLS